MRERISAAGFRAITSKRGDTFLPVKWAKGALVFANDMLGEPLRSEERAALLSERKRAEEIALAERAAARAAATTKVAPVVPHAKSSEVVPVVLYTNWNARHDTKRISDVLKSADVVYQTLDITDDESTLSWVKSVSGCEDLPVLFIAGTSVGGIQEVVQLDVSGELKRRVRGESAGRAQAK